MRLRLDPLAQNGISTVVDNTSVVNVGGSTTTSGATSLADLTDVDSTVSSPSDGDIIVYRDAGSDWVLEAKPAGGSNPAMNDISDVTITSVADNEVLAYDTGTSEWVNQTASEAGLAAASHTHTESDITDLGTYQDVLAEGAFVDGDKTKLDGIETGATADQSAAEIKTAYESNANTNAFTDAEQTKLSGIEAGADVTDTTNVTAAGALMDSEVTNLAQVKAFDSSDYATAAQGATADSALQDITGENIADLSDVVVTTPADNEVMAYDTTSGNWINQTPSEAGLATSAQGTLADSAVQPGDNISDLTNDSGYTTNTGTVTSVAATVPTGFTVSGSPVTTSGTLALGYDTGYQGYTTTEASKLAGIETGAEVNTVDSVNTKTGAVVLDPDDLDDTSTTNKFVTATDITKLSNLSGTNTGDQDLSSYQLKPAEGAFVDGDKTKLDGIETGADVTDATNVNAAGATMNSDTTLAGNGYFLDEDTMTSNSATKVASQQSIKAYVDTIAAVQNVLSGWNGWIEAGETWTYASNATHTNTNTVYDGTFTISGDKTTKYSVGMRVKFTQTTVKYGIITSVSYSAPNTTVRIFMGTAASLANAAITSNYYSTDKAPQGFDTDPSLWTTYTHKTSNGNQASPSASTWYQIGGTLGVPIGKWRVAMRANVQSNAAASTATVYVATAFSTNSAGVASDVNLVALMANEGILNRQSIFVETTVSHASAITYYHNVSYAGSTATQLYVIGSATEPSTYKAECAYL